MTIFIIDLYFATGYYPANTGALMEIHPFLNSVHGWRITLDLLLAAISGGFYTVPLYAQMITALEAKIAQLELQAKP